MLEADSLTKDYPGGVRALDSLDLKVPPGEVFCLLGPNGAGKTTTVNLFLGFVEPTAGRALVCGVDSRLDPLAARRKLAYIPENVMLYGKLTGLENLRYFSDLATGYRLDRGELLVLLDRAGFPVEEADRPVSGYSKGMRQKVGIAVALAKRAEALLLDEPTSGLDPLAANEFARLIETLRGEGMAILMVTHDLFLAQQCGVRVGIMRSGRLVRTLETVATDHLGLERAYLEASRVAEAS
ncbi:ABC transporter ATP-binding protein [Paludisphaera soli]|uniref:ABC transporter ATP-binding protein n=1 Tax=Paludisphaera soli TaxID=2712865 RepID=UPI0013EB86B9|nr:ABC transporter ATP-binding protein [Paludisphaera soli]